MKTEVIFGTGPVGLHTAANLIRRGYPVRLVNRSGTLNELRRSVLAEFDPHLYELRKADARDRSQVLEASRGAGTIYHCVNPLYHQWAEVLPPVQTNLIEAALENDAVLAVSENLYMYARGVDLIDLETPVNPPSRKGRIRLELHEALLAAGREKGLQWTSIRASDFYGPGSSDQSLFGPTYFLDPLYTGKTMLMPGNPDIPHCYSYVGDFGRALARAAHEPEALGQSWIIGGTSGMTSRNVAELFMDMSGKSGKLRRLPTWIIRLMGLADPVMRELLEMLYQKEEPYEVSGRHFEQQFDFVLTEPRKAVTETIEWYEALKTQG
ncbi:NAD-dependent epimerase/dehydratase family protein [Salinispira pacifica]|uniref:Nucleoside-diphosphate-sugar epimerase n=1 Tax=Salinispira pacifica TaxID=1307761 RepID=V5WMH1_9SPIO|nr:NAD-dependent epimerase/dehydratase family protein [Salinispira pacifica]AHC16356.1 Nucleoside-diphosphate-sugar epimerase [Salinispira pacifica]